MNKYIKRLQSKGEAERKQILVISLVLSMAMIGSIWVYSLGDRFSGSNEKSITEEDSTVKPFKLFANSISNTYKDISASVGNFSFKKENTEPEQKQIDLIPVEYPNAQ